MVAVVTGASKGIGKACALALAARGYDIAVNYATDDAAAQALCDELRSMGVRALACRADTADLDAVKAMFRTVLETLGAIDVLVNNAGIVNDAYLLTLREESLQRSLSVNIAGYFHCAQQAMLRMMRKKSGVILNISSVSAVVAIAGQSVYSATKGAVNAFTATLAKEAAPYGIRVNAVAPGFIDTEMTQKLPEEKRAEYRKAIPLGRFGTPQEVAELVCALCSDSFKYVTGQTIVLDGGLSL